MDSKRKLLFASHNAGKAAEINSLLSSSFEILTLNNVGIFQDIPETGKTLVENATIKAQYAANLSLLDCFADDTGLEVEALGGAPGVYSARYAGEPANSENNIQKLLFTMQNTNNRKAAFRTIIALILRKELYYFEGICAGKIANSPSGNHGFGYDSIFIPDGTNHTFAEMTLVEKNRYSHRAKAIKAFTKFLEQF